MAWLITLIICLTRGVWCTSKVKPRDGYQKELLLFFTQELRSIALSLTKVKTQKEATEWKAKLIKWEKAYSHLLKEKTYSQTEVTKTGPTWWHTHKNLKRGWRLLTDNWYPFFVHLDHPLVPSTNNSIEGVNSQAKRFLGNHRGMKTPQQVSFSSGISLLPEQKPNKI